jgi:hypothetical protein
MKTALFLFSILTLTACNDFVNKSTNNERPYIEKSKTVSITNFDEVSILGASTAQIEVGQFNMVVTGDSTDLSDLRLTTTDNKFSYFFSKQENQRFGLKLAIKMPNLKSITVSAASKVTLYHFDNQQIVATIFGASELDAFNMTSKRAIVDVSGASKAKISVTDNLDAIVSGASQLLYRGNPVLKTTIMEGSTIKQD